MNNKKQQAVIAYWNGKSTEELEEALRDYVVTERYKDNQATVRLILDILNERAKDRKVEITPHMRELGNQFLENCKRDWERFHPGEPYPGG